MKNCGNCANYDRQYKRHTDACAHCVTAYKGDEREDPSHWEPIPMTNADRIRAMSDKELADFLADRFARNDILKTSEPPMTATQISVIRHTWYKVWMQWLKAAEDK